MPFECCIGIYVGSDFIGRLCPQRLRPHTSDTPTSCICKADVLPHHVCRYLDVLLCVEWWMFPVERLTIVFSSNSVFFFSFDSRVVVRNAVPFRNQTAPLWKGRSLLWHNGSYIYIYIYIYILYMIWSKRILKHSSSLRGLGSVSKDLWRALQWINQRASKQSHY